MSGFSEETDCPKCRGKLFHVSTDNRDIKSNYAFCLECGYSYGMTESNLSLADLNETRKGWGLPPLTKPRKQIRQ